MMIGTLFISGPHPIVKGQTKKIWNFNNQLIPWKYFRPIFLFLVQGHLVDFMHGADSGRMRDKIGSVLSTWHMFHSFVFTTGSKCQQLSSDMCRMRDNIGFLSSWHYFHSYVFLLKTKAWVHYWLKIRLSLKDYITFLRKGGWKAVFLFRHSFASIIS